MTQATDTDIREIRDLLLGLDKKIGGVDKKLDVHIAKTEEQLKSLETQTSDLKGSTDTKLADLKQLIVDTRGDLKTDITELRLQQRAQDNRLWSFLGALFLSALGFLAKFAFFPGGQP
jgi:septal ring factor EnvC (AmiA/AmiB activator)